MLSRQDGFSLIELLTSAVMFGLATVGFASVLLMTVGANRVAKDTSTATAFAQEKLEEFRTVSPTANGSDTRGIYARTWAVTPVGAVKEVVVTVQWNDHGQRSVQLSSLFSN